MKAIAASVVVTCLVATVHADLVGLDPSSFTYNQNDPQPPAAVSPGSINITNSGSAERRSIWFNTRQDISTAFTATFTYRASSIAASGANQGIAFVMQNNAIGTAWVANGNVNVGYGGLTQSTAVTLETNTGPALTYSGFYTNGANGGGSSVISPVNAFGGTELHVTITYNGSLLTVAMTDGTNASSRNYLVGSLASTIGSSTAWIGFVAATGNGSSQHISNFSFTTVPTPGAAALLGITGITGLRRRR